MRYRKNETEAEIHIAPAPEIVPSGFRGKRREQPVIDMIKDTFKFILEEPALKGLLVVVLLVVLCLSFYFTRGIGSAFYRLLALPLVFAGVLLIFASPLLLMWGIWWAMDIDIMSTAGTFDLILGFLALLGALGFLGCRSALHRQRWLEKHGLRVQAVVVEHRNTLLPVAQPGEEVESEILRVNVNPVYRYEVNGQEYEFISNVTVDENGPELGSVQYLYVDPTRPKRCVGEDQGIGPLLTYGRIGGALVGVFLIRLAFSGRFGLLAGIVIFLFLMDRLFRWGSEPYEKKEEPVETDGTEETEETIEK